MVVYASSTRGAVDNYTIRVRRMDIPELLSEFPETIRKDCVAIGLRFAVAELSARGLVQATRWAAELHAALPQDTCLDLSANAVDSSQQIVSSATSEHVANCETSFIIAKSLFDSRQYRRCAAYLGRVQERCKSAENPAANFLRCFSTYLCTEKDLALDGSVSKTVDDRNSADLQRLRSELEKTDDPHCQYLLAAVLDKLDVPNKSSASRDLLVKSVRQFPWNWAAWKRLAQISSDPEDAKTVVHDVCRDVGDDDKLMIDGLNNNQRSSVVIARQYMGLLFYAWACLENDGAEEARDMYGSILGVLDTGIYFKGCLATCYYHLRLFDEAQELFEEIYDEDEYCLDGIDTYSNILYVKEDKMKLSMLAQRCVRVDKYCVETCCVVGNYYSLRGQHEQAVSYFQRALKLNRSYLSAWTLMGHEFVEMKNTAAAVEAYRRAVDVSPKDFRAWYGLGQTYELLDMPLYTLYYYSKAAALRPRDARMWCAMGQTLEELARLTDAVRAYERANGCDDREGLALAKLAALYERMAREMPAQRQQYTNLAARYHQKNLTHRDKEGMRGPETAASLRFLAKYAVSRKDFDDAEQLCMRLFDYPGLDGDCAKDILNEIHAQRAPVDTAMPVSASHQRISYL